MLDATSELQHAYRRSRKVAKSNDLMVDFGKTKIACCCRGTFFCSTYWLTRQYSYYKWTGGQIRRVTPRPGFITQSF
jgi:hypothetical protein